MNTQFNANVYHFTQEIFKNLIAEFDGKVVGGEDMKINDALPSIKVDPQTYEVFADGKLLTCEPAEVLPLAQRYLLLINQKLMCQNHSN